MMQMRVAMVLSACFTMGLTMLSEDLLAGKGEDHIQEVIAHAKEGVAHTKDAMHHIEESVKGTGDAHAQDALQHAKDAITHAEESIAHAELAGKKPEGKKKGK